MEFKVKFKFGGNTGIADVTATTAEAAIKAVKDLFTKAEVTGVVEIKPKKIK
jgi:hypothetical protein